MPAPRDRQRAGGRAQQRGRSPPIGRDAWRRADGRTRVDREIGGRVGPHVGRDGNDVAESSALEYRFAHRFILPVPDRRSVGTTLNPLPVSERHMARITPQLSCAMAITTRRAAPADAAELHDLAARTFGLACSAGHPAGRHRRVHRRAPVRGAASTNIWPTRRGSCCCRGGRGGGRLLDAGQRPDHRPRPGRRRRSAAARPPTPRSSSASSTVAEQRTARGPRPR